MDLKAKWVTYVGFVLMFVVLLAVSLGFISEQWAVVLGGVFGIVGVAGLRARMQTEGWKTEVIAAAGGILALALYLLKVVTVEQVKVIFAFLLSLAGITMNQAVTKQQIKFGMVKRR